MDTLIILLLQAGGLLLIHTTLWYFISLLLKRNDIADIAWGFGFCLVSGWLYFSIPSSPIAILVYVLVWLWAIRLSLHIYLRNRGKEEDFRYRNWRKQWGRSFYWRSYLQVYILQAFFLWIISSPLVAVTGNDTTWSWFTRSGLLIWITGFCFQAVGDYQLSVFVKTKKPGEVMQQGLWKYTRHPNYFGEILMWWGIFIIVAPFPYGYIFCISPITITWLLTSVSGIPMLEKKYDNNPAFQEYKKSTPALIPRFW